MLQLHEVILQNQPGTKTIRVYDCPGFVDNTYTLRERVFEEDLKHVIDGNVMKGYQVVHLKENNYCLFFYLTNFQYYMYNMCYIAFLQFFLQQ